MRPADGVLVRTEVDHGMQSRRAGPRGRVPTALARWNAGLARPRLHGWGGIRADVEPRRGEHCMCLRREGAAAEEAA